MSESPYVGVVVDLVDPYFTPEVKNVGGFKPSSGGAKYAIWWMRQHPGRWALVGEGTTGLTRQLLKTFPDIQVTEKGKSPNSGSAAAQRTYARLPHPEGESINEALGRRPISPMLYLPEVTRDEFDWSPAELAEACRIARDNLFPVGS